MEGTLFDPLDDAENVFRDFHQEFQYPKTVVTIDCSLEDCNEQICAECSECDESDCDSVTECHSDVCHNSACSISSTTPCSASTITPPSDAPPYFESVYNTPRQAQIIPQHEATREFGQTWKGHEQDPIEQGFNDCLADDPELHTCVKAAEHEDNQAAIHCCWDGCETVWPTEEDLATHFNNFHHPNPTFQVHFHSGNGTIDPSITDHSHLRQGPNHEDWYVCCCPGCEARFQTAELLDNHFKTVHWPENGQKVECRWNASHGKSCGVIVSNENLSDHMANDHFGAYKLHPDERYNPPTLPPCLRTKIPPLLDEGNIQTSSWDGVSSRLGESSSRSPSQNESETLRCKWEMFGPCQASGTCCDFIAKDEIALQDHVENTHLAGIRKPKDCICWWQGCKRFGIEPFSQRAKLERHMKSHTHDKRFKCTGYYLKDGSGKCEAAFATQIGLEQHIRSHTEERRYECDVCGKSFTASTSLTMHKRTHTGEKPLVCGIGGCQKRFSESSNLAKHRRTHEEPNIPCPICDKKFNRADGLKRHIQNHHAAGSEKSKSKSRSRLPKIPKRTREERSESTTRPKRPSKKQAITVTPSV